MTILLYQFNRFYIGLKFISDRQKSAQQLKFLIEDESGTVEGAVVDSEDSRSEEEEECLETDLLL